MQNHTTILIKILSWRQILKKPLHFKKNLANTLTKANKNVGLLKKFQTILPGMLLFIIYKSFIRPSLNYGNLIHDQTYNTFFHKELKRCNIRATSKEKLCQKLGLNSFQQRQCFRKICYFFKIFKKHSPMLSV